MRRRAVWVNDAGYAIGEDHHSSKLTDHEVELVRTLHAEGMPTRVIAEKFEVSRQYVRAICAGRARTQFAVDQKFLEPTRLRYRRRPARPDEFDGAD